MKYNVYRKYYNWTSESYCTTWCNYKISTMESRFLANSNDTYEIYL